MITPSYSVLIIEDEKNILDFMTKALKANNYKVFTAASGNAGLALITSQCPDVVLLDLGLPDIDETAMMKEVIGELQSITSLPLQIDTVEPSAMEAAMRMYNGKPMINSVNGKQESMDQVFPLVKKYGGVVVGLTLDEAGIPADAEGRAKIAGKIIAEAAKYGILPKDIVIDVLAMTVSSDPEGAKTTLEALRLVREDGAAVVCLHCP